MHMGLVVAVSSHLVSEMSSIAERRERVADVAATIMGLCNLFQVWLWCSYDGA